MKNLKEQLKPRELKLINISFDIYSENRGYINQYRLFHAYFGVVPNVKKIFGIDMTALRIWIANELKDEIQLVHYEQCYESTQRTNLYTDLYYIFKNNIVIYLCNNCVFILFIPKNEIAVREFENSLYRFQLKTVITTKISFIVNSNRGLTTKDIVLKKPVLNFLLHYNDDFKIIHQNILKNIKKKHTKGLYLFHGLPGTGKSTYIKYLIHRQNKKVIFLSPSMAGKLDNIELTNFLLDNQNCVLVIEDAEELILSRDNQHNSKLSFLLNLTDGLLGECLGIQIIATFNTDLKNIDKALLRKGRLTAIYEFKELELFKTNSLLKQLGNDVETKNPMVLADIFNFTIDTNYQPKLKKAVGFGN